ncbi:FecR family protein [Rhodohalobacter sp. SW132]|uniref:FecR family protein n=1 Tax=Rhodohalobacter sp. SW132 TaxID=2293433 RepID=UPI00131517BD|nr:FecR domain-containing protein [Rhodohalobacter sp. SW132]
MRWDLDPADDLEFELERLTKRIDRSEQQNKLPSFKKMQPKNNSWGYRVSVAATILIILSSLGLLFLFNPTETTEQNAELLFETVETGDEERKTLTFSDGSLIELNAESSLRYRLEQFQGERVEVWLKGEGFFDIPTNPGGTQREFIVHTDDGKIQVLGTRFNVDTRFQKTSVVLEEGRVEVSGNDSQGLERASKILNPGERAVINKSSSEIIVQKVDVGLFTAWIDGEVEFRNTSLKDIFSAIEAIYNVSLEVESPELLNRQVTGTIQNPDLQILLNGLQQILDLQITQVDNEKYLISQ